MKKLFGSLLISVAGVALLVGCSSQQRTADTAENEGMREGQVAGTIEETTPSSPSVGTTTDTGGMAGTTDGAGTTAATDGPITDTFQLAAGTNKKELVGRDVRLDNVQVLQVMDNGTFLVGSTREEAIPVVLSGGMAGEMGGDHQAGGMKTRPSARSDVKEGQRVSVRGVVRDAKELPDSAALAGDREIFISAFSVEEAATLGE